MANIHVLDKHTAELIAAGEVVERPSSVVKEMVENALDAGASAVTVEIKNGGTTYIRITDNGCGIHREDVPRAFLRHATSKIQKEEDLNRIVTLGFRGEALASIAAVTRLELLTKTSGEPFGTRYVIEGGEEVLLDDAGCPVGSTFVIKDLFYNTPARMKFLKKNVAEGNAVADVLDRMALSHPGVAFTLIRDGKKVLSTPGDGKLYSAVYGVYGREFADGLIPVDYTMGNIRLTGYTCKPVYARKNRSMQLFFVNGRFIRTGTGSAALQEAYKNAIMVGKFPAGVYHLSFPYEEIDVNVHPAKIEVRFSNERAIFDAIYYGVKSALEKGDRRPTAQLPGESIEKYAQMLEQPTRLKKASTAFQKPISAPVSQTAPKVEPKQTKFQMVSPQDAPVVKNPTMLNDSAPLGKTFHTIPATPYKPSVTSKALDVAVPEKEPIVTESLTPPQTDPLMDVNVRLIGEAFDTYILAQVDQRILIIDKHAAHERILFDKLKETSGKQSAQMLLSPVTLTLRKDEYTLLQDNLALLEEAGIILESFGENTYRVCSVPMNLESESIGDLIDELVSQLKRGVPSVYANRLDWLFHSIACRSAVKGGKPSSDKELETLAKRIAVDDSVRYCPHGRPVAMWLTKAQLEKQFGRS